MARPERPCGCDGPEHCRKCAIRKAHEFRINGDEKMFESWLAVAAGLMNIERVSK